MIARASIRAILILFCASWAGCASAAPLGYRLRLAEGRRAYSAGRFGEAARSYEQAAAAAGPGRDREEAMYRAAMACRRGNNPACATDLLSRVASCRDDGWGNVARARFELASMALDSGDPAYVAIAHRALAALMAEVPDTGPARSALRLYLRSIDAADPTHETSVAWLASLAADPRIRRSDLLESILSARAVRLEARGDRSAAEQAWRVLLEQVPYPGNSRWDDGHLALARLQRATGRPRDALATLGRMLAVRETSWGNGSYAAPRFDDGAILVAEILRDDLGDAAAAAVAFHRVYAEHPTSLRRDDALWQEAELQRSGHAAGACRTWRILAAEFPCGRFGSRARALLAGCSGGVVSARCAEGN